MIHTTPFLALPGWLRPTGSKPFPSKPTRSKPSPSRLAPFSSSRLRRIRRTSTLLATLATTVLTLLLDPSGALAETASPRQLAVVPTGLAVTVPVLPAAPGAAAPGGRWTLAEVPSRVAAATPQADPFLVVADYLHRLASEDFGSVAELYRDPTDAMIPAMASLLRGLLGDDLASAEIVLRESWLVDDYRLLLVEIHRPSGDAELVSLGVEQVDGRFYRSDDWQQWQSVQHLLWLATGNLRRGGVLGAEVERPGLRLDVSLDPSAAGLPLGVDLSGHLHAAADGATVAEPTGAADFAHQVARVARSGDGLAFLGLWHDDDLAHVSQLFAEASGGFTALVEDSPTQFRDVFTADLGDVAVHYYVEASSPRELRTLTLRRQGDSWRRTLQSHSNLHPFLTSELLRRAILDAWTAAGGDPKS